MVIRVQVGTQTFEDWGPEYLRCSECPTRDGTVVFCDFGCGTRVCIEHDDKPEMRGYDSDLTLCGPCGDQVDQEAKVCEHDSMEFDMDGVHYKSCRLCMLNLNPEERE